MNIRKCKLVKEENKLKCTNCGKELKYGESISGIEKVLDEIASKGFCGLKGFKND